MISFILCERVEDIWRSPMFLPFSFFSWNHEFFNTLIQHFLNLQLTTPFCQEIFHATPVIQGVPPNSVILNYSLICDDTEKCLRQNLFGIECFYLFNLATILKRPVKATLKSLNAYLCLLLRVLLADVQTFSKHYKLVCFALSNTIVMRTLTCSRRRCYLCFSPWGGARIHFYNKFIVLNCYIIK